VAEELISLKSLHGTTRGENSFLGVCESMKELELAWTKLKKVTKDRAPSVNGNRTGVMDRIK
jgi:hypothetical protein